MVSNIIVIADHSDRITPFLNNLLNDIGDLLNIRGFFLEENESQYKYHQIKTGSHFLSILKNNSSYPKEKIAQAEMKLLNEMSLFPNPDLFIFDGFGNMECNSGKFCQQIMTLFESRIPVIIALKDKNHPVLQKLDKTSSFHIVYEKKDDQPESYINILNFLK